MVPHAGIGEEVDEFLDCLLVGLKIDGFPAVDPDGVDAGLVAEEVDNAVWPALLFGSRMAAGAVGAKICLGEAEGGGGEGGEEEEGEERFHGLR